ncbi:putative ribonuclease H-like domain-containing protein [Tanacetum coccineum]
MVMAGFLLIRIQTIRGGGQDRSEHLENNRQVRCQIQEPKVHQEQDANVNSTNNINTVCLTVNAANIENNVVDENKSNRCIDDPSMPNLEEIVYSDDDEEVGAEADMNNLATTVPVSPILTTRVHKDHPLEQIIRDIHSTPQTRRMTKNVTKHGFEDPEFPNKVYKVEKALYGLHQALRAWYETLSTYLLENRFRIGTIDKTLFIKKDKDDIMLMQVYVDDIIFGSTKRSMIGSLIYLTASRPDIMFVVCTCARFQVTPKTSHLYDVKKIFRYLKDHPKLGLWYPRDSPFDLEAFSDSDYAGASLDRKSTTGGCQFLGRRLISWQCKKQTIVANSTTEAEYVAAANCCGQVLWIQNQLLDYGYNFMNTKIYIDNESTICIVKNPVFHSKTKHIEIRHHFIRDSYEKRLIQVIKIHTDHNVADLLTKAFNVSRFQYLIASIGMLNL